MAKSSYVGAASPEYLTVTVTPGGYVTDLTAVLSASLRVVRPDGSEATWACSIYSQSASSLVLLYTYAAGGGDLPSAGTYRVVPRLTSTFGTVSATHDLLTVSLLP